MTLPKLTGKRTYLVAVAMVLYAAIGLWLGKVEEVQAVQEVLLALGLAGLRAAKNEKGPA